MANKKGDLKTGEKYYNKAIAYYNKSQLKLNLAICLYDRGSLYESTNKNTLALNDYTEALKLYKYIIDHTSDIESQKRLREMGNKYFEAPIRVLFKLMESKKGSMLENGSKAFVFLEQGRSMILYQRLRKDGIQLAVKSLPAEVVAQEAQLKNAVSIAEAAVKAGKDPKATEKLKNAEKALASFGESLYKSKDPYMVAYASLVYPRELDVKALNLKDGELLVEFLQGEDGIYRWVIDKKGLVSFGRINWKPDNVGEMVKRLRTPMDRAGKRSIGGREFAEMAGAGTELYDGLLRDVMEKQAKVIRLIIVPDGDLYRAPFEQFVVGKKENGDPVFLGLDRVITYEPSARSLVLQRTLGDTGVKYSKGYFGVGDPVYDRTRDQRCSEKGQSCPFEEKKAGEEEMLSERNVCKAELAAAGDEKHGKSTGTVLALSEKRLEETKRGEVERSGAMMRLCCTRNEVEQALKTVDGQGETLFLGLKATKENVQKALENDSYRVVHFSTHGILPDTDNCGDGKTYCNLHPALVLTEPADKSRPEGQYLTMGDIFVSRIPTEIVLLSACQTGIGEIHRGEGVSGIGQAFLYAGAKSVIMSLWSISDESTALFVTDFLKKSLKDGKDRGTAILEARRALANNPDHPEWAHPFYWAPFVLYGATE